MNRTLIACLLAAAAAAVPVFAQTNAVDPRAEAVLRDLAAFFRDAPAFTVDMEAATRLESEDMKQEFTTRATLAVRKPARLAMSVRNAMIGSLQMACDGTTLTTYLPALKRYTVKPAPATLNLLSAEMDASSPACLPVISALFQADPYEALVKDARSIRHKGEETRGGVPCHRLEIAGRDFDCEAWIRTGPRPLIEAVKPRLPEAGREGQPAAVRTDILLVLTNWAVGVDLPDERFRIDLPDDAKRVEHLIPDDGEAGFKAGPEAPEAGEPDPAEAMKSKPAPAFTLPLLAGGEFTLAAHKEKAAVVLCFWTSWAGPCRLTLPVIQKVAADYRDRQVAVLSINQQESRDAIAGFLKDAGVQVPVALDVKSEVAALYQVEGVPQIVIIDRSGVVRDVYIGYGKSTEADLRAMLDGLPAAAPARAQP